MKGEYPDLEAAAEEYQGRLRGPLDCLVLGIGEDGHVASLFPNGAAVGERERRVLAVFDSPKPPPRRLTLTARAIAEAREVLVLASGVGEGGRGGGGTRAGGAGERDSGAAGARSNLADRRGSRLSASVCALTE